MMFRKLFYGFTRFCHELFNIEDYWHLSLNPIKSPRLNSEFVYFHNMSAKGDYPGRFQDGVPIYFLNGVFPVYFHITTFNYGLGLLDKRKNGNDVDSELLQVLLWTVNNQLDDGSWRYNFPDSASHALKSNKGSGMTQGLAISFVIRCCRLGLIDRVKCSFIVEKAVKYMLSSEIVAEIDVNGSKAKIIEEFYSPGHGVLNGFIFAIYGLYDYSVEFGKTDIFDLYIKYLKVVLPKFKKGLWSYYDLKSSISSKFYHRLHIHMMRVLYDLTGELVFKEYEIIWRKGLKYSLVYIILKSVQKLAKLKSMPMNYARRSN